MAKKHLASQGPGLLECEEWMNYIDDLILFWGGAELSYDLCLVLAVGFEPGRVILLTLSLSDKRIKTCQVLYNITKSE